MIGIYVEAIYFLYEENWITEVNLYFSQCFCQQQNELSYCDIYYFLCIYVYSLLYFNIKDIFLLKDLFHLMICFHKIKCGSI